MKNSGFGVFLVALTILTIFQEPLFSTPMDSLIKFYTSPLPNPPKIYIDLELVAEKANTGDIIIENDRAYAQWYIAIAALVPKTKFVHSGVVVTGEDLANLNKKFKKIFKDSSFEEIIPQKWERGTVINKKKKNLSVWRWMPTTLDLTKKYIVTPANVGIKADNIVAALDLHDYLVHPSYGTVKHIQLIRPNSISDEAKKQIVEYLGMHLYKKTAYDMGFSLAEVENFNEIDQLKETSFKAVPVYCTELCFRAWAKAGISVPVMKLDKGIPGKIRQIPGLPQVFVGKISENFVIADCFSKAGTIIYQNEPSPTVKTALGVILKGSLKAFGEAMKEKFSHLSNQ